MTSGDGSLSLEQRIKAEAERLGFSLCGIAPATDADAFPQFERWLDSGFAGDMHYLQRTRAARQHPRSVLESVRSVIMVGLEYGQSPTSARIESAQRPARVAQYAQGPDYHTVIWDRLNSLAVWLQQQSPDCQTRGITDTAPLLERDFARRAGLGWIGKNTMLIHKGRGSFFFLGALLTSLALHADASFDSNHCGKCRACLDACPTEAFVGPGVLDARKCISYLTIEIRTPVPEPLRKPIGNWIWGCDVCQDVCPWNRFAGSGSSAFPHEPALESLDPVEILQMTEEAFRARFKKTALWRNRRTGLRRNAAIVLGNGGDSRAVVALESASRDADEVVAEACRWAIEQIRLRGS